MAETYTKREILKYKVFGKVCEFCGNVNYKLSDISGWFIEHKFYSTDEDLDDLIEAREHFAERGDVFKEFECCSKKEAILMETTNIFG